METLDDKHEVYMIYSSSCTLCKHFKKEEFKCAAFPEGIPDEILLGVDKHKSVHKNQSNDITFTPN